jgi:hypothetical protein
MTDNKEFNEGYEHGFRVAVIRIANKVDVELLDRDEIIEYLDELLASTE